MKKLLNLSGLEVPSNKSTSAYKLMYPFLSGPEAEKTARLFPNGKYRNGSLTRRQHSIKFRYERIMG